MSLEHAYEEYLAGKTTGVPLREFLEAEDRYLERVHMLLQNIDPTLVTGYVSPWAFSGGGNNMSAILRQACTDVQDAASRTGANIPSIFGGVWPDRRLNAQSFMVDDGCLILVNAGLIQGIRFFLQYAALSASTIRGDQYYNQDALAIDQVTSKLATALDEHEKDKSSMWTSYPVNVVSGKRELLRRDMIYSALCLVIAHEAGHHARSRPWQGGWRDDNAEFQEITEVPDPSHPENQLPKTVNDATRSFSSELIADLIACSILRELPISHPSRPNAALIWGAMSVSALQAAGWWNRAATTDRPLGWTHPVPDLRTDIVGAQLAKEGAEQVDFEPNSGKNSALFGDLATRFSDWSLHVLGISRNRESVSLTGLHNRGVNPATLAGIYMTNGHMLRGQSDIVKKLAQDARHSGAVSDGMKLPKS